MNQIFDLGEQLAELIQVSANHECRDMQEMTPKLWSTFIQADAQSMLKEKHFGGTVNRAKLLFEVKKHQLQVTTDDPEELAELTKALQYIADIDSGNEAGVPKEALEYIHSVDDAIDDIYYDVGTEIQECVDGFYTRGDLWIVDLATTSKALIFSFVCRRSSVEAAVRAAGGNMGDFVRHFTG